MGNKIKYPPYPTKFVTIRDRQGWKTCEDHVFYGWQNYFKKNMALWQSHDGNSNIELLN